MILIIKIAMELKFRGVLQYAPTMDIKGNI